MKNNAKYNQDAVKNDAEMRRWYRNEDLHRIINQAAKRYATKNVEHRADLRQEGWLRVAQSESEDPKHLTEEARRAVEAAYRRNKRHREREVDLVYVGGWRELAMIEEIQARKATGQTPARGGSDNPSWGDGDADYLGGGSDYPGGYDKMDRGEGIDVKKPKK